jgi:uncharacterized protein YdaU (DUF1376 family)
MGGTFASPARNEGAIRVSQTPFMPLWVADFVGDTLDLDAKEIGAYMLILMTMWGRDGYLPNDEKKLQRVARCGRDWPRVWTALAQYFTVDGDRITQARLLKEVQKVAAKRIVSAQHGAIGGRAKALKNKEAALADATVPLQQPEPYLELEKKEEKREAKASPKKSPSGSRLDADWFLPMAWGEWALNEGMDQSSIRLEADRFKDYWLSVAGAKGRKADWQATWRNWIRKHLEDKSKDGKNGDTKGGRKIRSWLAGSSVSPPVDSWPDTDASLPLLARR